MKIYISVQQNSDQGEKKYLASMCASLNTEIMTVCNTSLGEVSIFIVIFTIVS